jgi:hypothetical protein
VTCVILRDRELFVGMIVLTALLDLAGGILYFSYRLNPGVYRQWWDDYLEPFRFVIRLFI